MKKNSFSTKIFQLSSGASVSEAATADLRLRKFKSISTENLAKILAGVQEKLTEGLSSAAEKILNQTLANFTHTPENQARIHQLLSYTLETQGRYKESLEVIEKYDDEELLNKLEPDTQIGVITQLAIALNNTDDYPQAVALLKHALEQAQEADLTDHFGAVGRFQHDQMLRRFHNAIEQLLGNRQIRFVFHQRPLRPPH